MRPHFLHRINFVESRLPYEDDVAPDASRTFGPVEDLQLATDAEWFCRWFLLAAVVASAVWLVLP